MSKALLAGELQTKPRAVRLIVLVNFLLLAAWFGPLNSDKLYHALRNARLLRLEVALEQLWVVGSTLFATGLLLWRVAKNRRITPGGSARPDGTTLDSVLLLAWWLTLIGICMYAFMLGMAG